MYLSYYDNDLSEINFRKYLEYSSSGTFFSKKPDLKWLLDLFYCIITDNVENFEYFLSEDTDYNKNTVNKNYFIDSKQRMMKSIKAYSVTFDEKQALYSLNVDVLQMIVERYPIFLLKYLSFLSSYCSRQCEALVIECIDKYRYTEFYDKMMVGWYS